MQNSQEQINNIFTKTRLNIIKNVIDTKTLFSFIVFRVKDNMFDNFLNVIIQCNPKEQNKKKDLLKEYEYYIR